MSDEQDIIRYIGLGIYTFSDLREAGLTVVRLVESWQRTFPAYTLSHFAAVSRAEQAAKSAVDARPMKWTELRSELQKGQIARFHAQSATNSAEAESRLQLRLNADTSPTGNPNHMIARLPLGAFSGDGDASQALLSFGKEAFAALNGSYGYGGPRITGTSSNAVAQAINESIGKLQIGDFDDVNISSGFRERVKGAFWVNLLSGRHVELLGGIEQVRSTAPCHRVEALPGAGALLLLAPHPIWDGEEAMVQAYAALRDYLRPLIVTVQPKLSPLLERTGVIQRKSYTT